MWGCDNLIFPRPLSSQDQKRGHNLHTPRTLLYFCTFPFLHLLKNLKIGSWVLPAHLLFCHSNPCSIHLQPYLLFYGQPCPASLKDIQRFRRNTAVKSVRLSSVQTASQTCFLIC